MSAVHPFTLYGWFCDNCSEQKDDYSSLAAAQRGADEHAKECEDN
jgi:hypothetical protein